MKYGFFSPSMKLLCCDRQLLSRWNHPNRSAPYWRLYWNSHPGAAVVLDGQETRLIPEHFVLIPPNTPFAACMTTPVKHFFLHFTAGAPFDAVEPSVLTFPATPRDVRMVMELAGLLEADGDHHVRISLLALSLAHYALTRVPRHCLTLERFDSRIQDAVDRLADQLDTRVSNDELASRAGMNKNAFVRRFRQVTGHTPQRYGTMKRIERACLMLHYSTRTIEDIAAATGFCDRYHFSRAFKRHRGLGPAAFRKAKEHLATEP